MLRHRLGRDKVDADMAATTRLLQRTGRLPLALAVVAAQAAARPEAGLGELDDQLASAGSRLDAFPSTDERSNLRAVFSWSHQSVSPAAAHLFRVLGLHPTPDLSLDALASLSGRGERDLRPLLQELQATNLLGMWANGRVVLHDLLHAFAAELAVEGLTDREQSAATRRVLDHYAHTAHLAADLIDPVRDGAALVPTAEGAITSALRGEPEASAWLLQNRKALLACPDLALARDLLPHAWQTAWAVADLLVSTAAWESLETLLEGVLVAAQRDGADHAIARAHQLLGRAHRHLDHHDRAEAHLKQAFTAALTAGDTVAQARAMSGLATLAEDRDDWTTSLLHDRATLALAQAEDLRGIVAETLNHVGWDLAQLGRHQEAAAYCTRSLGVAQELGHRRVEAAAWDSLGFINRRRGRLADALTTYTRALRIRQDLDHEVGMGKTHIALGDTYADLEDLDEATGHWTAGIEILDRVSPVRARSERRRLEGLVDVPGPPH
jgi:tetratricopeptide (TPR) repeat protein